MIAPPFATLADGAVVPLTNCTACGELGRADMAHYHVCRPSESECATLRAEVERLRAREGGVDNLDAQIVELRTEVERLRAELALESELATLHAGGASRAESRLSAATELLERTSKVAHEDDLDARIALVDAVDAFLAAQPAAPEHNECVSCGQDAGDGNVCVACSDPYGQPAAPARTEAERINETELVTLHDAQTGAPFVLSVREIRAELARREAAK